VQIAGIKGTAQAPLKQHRLSYEATHRGSTREGAGTGAVSISRARASTAHLTRGLRVELEFMVLDLQVPGEALHVVKPTEVHSRLRRQQVQPCSSWASRTADYLDGTPSSRQDPLAAQPWAQSFADTCMCMCMCMRATRSSSWCRLGDLRGLLGL
jgi:hypothetical protein